VVATAEGLFVNQKQMTTLFFEDGHSAVGSANVTCQNH
jgi:hypothetical protein